MSSAPKVSIVMAAYNAAPFIHKAIDSVRRQTFADWELIIIDDCSTDQTQEAVAAYVKDDPRLICQKMPVNKGPSATRNAGFAVARGEWITVLDSDDRYEPDRLEILLKQAEIHKADIVADNHFYYDEAADRIVGKGFCLGCDSLPLTAARFVRNCGTPCLFTLSLLKPFIRRDFLQRTGLTYPEDIRIGEDFHFLFSLIWRGGKTVLLDKAGYIYTMPYGWVSKKLSTQTRTDHKLSGWDVMIEAKLRILGKVRQETPHDHALIAALQELTQQYRREKAWRELKAYLRAGSYRDAAKILTQINLIPYLRGKILCKLRSVQPIKR